MTDSQIIFGILQNDERAWRHICREMRAPFASIIRNTFSTAQIANEDINDIFQEALVALMQNVKGGSFVLSREGALFSYLVQIGKLKACNRGRKTREKTANDKVTFAPDRHNSDEETDISVEEKQKEQNEFIDRVLGLLPAECKALLKYFYWSHKPMDEIASILGMRNADSVKTKKSKCMNKAKDIAKELIENDEFAEEAIRNAIERMALRELVEEEIHNAESGICMAALDTNDNDEE